MPQLDGHRLVFVDEGGYRPGQRLAYGYAPRGQRCLETAPLRPTGRLNMLGWMAASCGEVVTVEEKVTGAIFEQFVAEHLVPSLEVGDIVVWDNARIHTSRAVALVEAAGARVLALPRYSPEFNAIEHLWSKLKHYMRKARADTVAALKKALYAAMERVTASDAAGWIRHCGYTINPTG
jgi:transposase